MGMTLIALYWAVVLLPAVAMLFVLRMKRDTQEQVFRLIQVPVLKGDLNRILKVFSTYSEVGPDGAFVRAAHQMTLKIKRLWAAELPFQEGLADVAAKQRTFAFGSWGVTVVQLIVMVTAASREGVVMWYFGLLGVAVYRYAASRRYGMLGAQATYLYRFRALLYGNINKFADTPPVDGGYVPAKYRPILLSGQELADYKARMQAFVDGVKQRKDGGQTVDAQSEWEAQERQDVQVEEAL